MITWEDVIRWEPGPLQDAVGPLNTAYNNVVACSDDLRDLNTPYGWLGEAATAAANEVDQIIDGLEEYAAEVAAARRSIGDTGDAITGVQNGVREVLDMAGAHHFVIGDDGAIVDNGPPANVPDDQKNTVAQERQHVATDLRARVEEVLRQAEDIDADFCIVLDRILSGHTIDASTNDNQQTSLAAAGNAGDAWGSLSILSPPPADASPSTNAAWWATLSRNQQLRSIHDHPEIMGNRDGIAAWARDKANRAMFDSEYAQLKSRESELHKKIQDSTFKGVFNSAVHELSDVEAKLHSMDKIKEVIARPDRQLLVMDLSHERAQAAVAVGNVDKADHVAVFTPGMTTRVDGDLGSYDTDMDNLRKNTMDQLDRAGRSNETVATVDWIGYQAPQNPIEVASDDIATQGGKDLSKFYEGINDSRPADPHLTALSHSYGTTTTGMALQHGNTGVDDTVFYGSPGIPGIGTHNVQDLHVPDGHVYDIQGRNDPVAHLAQFGQNLDQVKGIQELSAKAEAGPNGQMSESAWHSYYLQDNSTSQFNQASIVAGLPQNAIRKN
jgi:hypothetical protein